MSEHTPGPWVAKGTRVMPPDSCGHIACCGIAECYHGSNEEEAEANARLIAAAPDLLEALQDVIGWVPSGGPWATDAPLKSLERARAAIRQATTP